MAGRAIKPEKSPYSQPWKGDTSVAGGGVKRNPRGSNPREIGGEVTGPAPHTLRRGRKPAMPYPGCGSAWEVAGLPTLPAKSYMANVSGGYVSLHPQLRSGRPYRGWRGGTTVSIRNLWVKLRACCSLWTMRPCCEPGGIGTEEAR